MKMPGRFARPILCLWTLSLCTTAFAQQVADPDFAPVVENPMHLRGSGPVVLIDEGHGNYHTKDGRYAPFARLVEADGYRVGAHQGAFRPESIGEADVIVISNALNPANVERWEVPVLSAFADDEVRVLVDFVESGGALFLIADHMPFPGAAAPLAAVFGIEFSNGFALEPDAQGQQSGPSLFKRSDARIGEHVITSGRDDSESIDQVATFTGSAFPVTGDAVSLLKFGDNATMLLPSVAWQFNAATARAQIPGWSQGAALQRGAGRVVIFGEAAMFSSQRSGDGPPSGMTAPMAEDNQQLLLNIVRWLSSDL
jgi:hypothetical protein